MKRTFTIITLVALTSLSTLSLGAAFSKLHLDLFNDGQFVVVVDGIRYPDVRSGVDIGGLRPGTHHIRIVEVFRGRAHRNRGRTVLYQGSINIPFRSAVFARLTPNLRLRITEVRRLRQPQQRYRNRNRNRTQGPHRGYYNRRGGHQSPMMALEVTKAEINRATWDRDKLQIAKDFAVQGEISSSEVASLMNLLTYEKTKLQFAKFSYNKVFDKQNFHLVNNAFTYDSSIRELNRHIGGNRRR